jgi:hypothetical protein
MKCWSHARKIGVGDKVLVQEDPRYGGSTFDGKTGKVVAIFAPNASPINSIYRVKFTDNQTGVFTLRALHKGGKTGFGVCKKTR